MEDLWKTIVLGIVEGVTEFLPISSTGHLVLCEHWMGIDLSRDFWKTFTVFIQIGAIAAVVVYFRRRIAELLGSSVSAARPASSPLALILLATVPVLVIGFLAHKWVEANLESAFPIAMALLIGGVVMLAVEWLRPQARAHGIEQITLTQAMLIGGFQVLSAVFPGTSRSAATIIGGMVVGLSRHVAAEFSFFLAIPSMSAAAAWSMLKLVRNGQPVEPREWLLLLIGTVVSYLVAWAVIAAFMAWIRRHSFVPFAVYRLVLAGFVLWVLRG